YAFRGGGTALARAWRTVRRCTRCRTASSRIEDPPARQSRLICSNSSTRDLAIPDLRASRTDAKDQIQGGATIRDDTPAHPPSEITTQAGPQFATKACQTGASSGDHTQPRVSRAAACKVR